MEIDKVKEEEEEKRNRKGAPPASGSSDPWLLYIHDKRGSKHSFYKISQGIETVSSIHCMRRKIVLASSHGWLFLHNTSSLRCYLFNPISTDKIELPSLKQFNYDVCLISSPPTKPNCTVLFIRNSVRRGRNTVTLRFCRPKIDGANDRWIKKHQDSGPFCIEHTISFQENIFGIDYSGGTLLIIRVVDTATVSLRRIVMDYEIPLPLLPEYDNTKKILVESGVDLYVVRLILWDELDPFVIQDVQVFMMKLGVHGRVWEKVDSIGDDRAFFFSSNCSTSCSAKKAGIAGNTIYFTLKKDTSLYAFNLKDKSISVSLPCPNVKFNWSEPTWVLPS